MVIVGFPSSICLDSDNLQEAYVCGRRGRVRMDEPKITQTTGILKVVRVIAPSAKWGAGVGTSTC